MPAAEARRLAQAAADLATASMSTGEPPPPEALARARAELAAAVREAPEDLEVLFLAFQFHTRIGEPGPAEGYARRRLALCPAGSPLEARARTNLGLAVFQQGRVDEAEPHFARAVEISGALGRMEDLARDLGNSACIPEARGEFEKVEAISRQVLEITRGLGTAKGDELAACAVFTLGDMAKNRGRDAEALELWRRAKAELDRLGVTKWNPRLAERLGGLEGGGAAAPGSPLGG